MKIACALIELEFRANSRLTAFAGLEASSGVFNFVVFLLTKRRGNRITDLMSYTRRRLVLGLLNGENLVSDNIVQHLTDPAWPTDFNIFDPLVTTEAKVHPIVT